jgi:hypothetical protein
MERSNLKELHDVECKEKFCVEVTTMSAALEDLDPEMEFNSTWETITEILKNKS